MITLYNVVSEDGYIARKDGNEDFIPDELWPATLEVFKKYDAVILGRHSYDAVQGYSEDLKEAFEALPIRKIVVSRNTEFQARQGYEVIHSLEEISAYGRVLVASGPEVNTQLLNKGMVGEIIQHQVPVTIGEGIKPFTGDLPAPVSEEAAANGVKLLTYKLSQNILPG